MQILLPALPVIQYLYRQHRDCPAYSQSLHAGHRAERFTTGHFLIIQPQAGDVDRPVHYLCRSLACLFAESIEFLILGRFVQAFGGGGTGTGSPWFATL